MIFTIEPMINLGKPHVKVLADGWTAVTRDRSLTAQYEHTVASPGWLRDFHAFSGQYLWPAFHAVIEKRQSLIV